MRTITVSFLGVAALVAGLLLVRQQRAGEDERPRFTPPGESLPGTISLDRLRASGY